MRFLSLLPALAGFLLVGCGGGQDSKPPYLTLKLYEVSGTVTLDGEPLVNGEIEFSPHDSSHNPDRAEIKDGHYALQVKTGKQKVKIYSFKTERLAKAQWGPQGEPITETRKNFIPTKYNEATTLTTKISKARELSFHLKSK